jgi:hypothetical protein
MTTYRQHPTGYTIGNLTPVDPWYYPLALSIGDALEKNWPQRRIGLFVLSARFEASRRVYECLVAEPAPADANALHFGTCDITQIEDWAQRNHPHLVVLIQTTELDARQHWVLLGVEAVRLVVFELAPATHGADA